MSYKGDIDIDDIPDDICDRLAKLIKQRHEDELKERERIIKEQVERMRKTGLNDDAIYKRIIAVSDGTRYEVVTMWTDDQDDHMWSVSD